MKPSVSIVIPCYNDGHFLPDAIGSVEKYPDSGAYEIVLVNDGSSEPGTLNVLSDLENKGYKVIHQANRGLGAARNAGVRATTGRYILPLDSDNKIRPEYISEGVRVLESNPRVGVVYGDVEYFGEKAGINRVPPFSLAQLVQRNFIDACALFRRDVWAEVGGYDENMPVAGWEDWEFWLRVSMKNWGFFHLEAVLFEYRVRSGSLISRTNQHTRQLYDYIFNKEELKDAAQLRQRYLESARLLCLEGSPDYRLGHAVLDPLRKIKRLFRPGDTASGGPDRGSDE